MKNNTKKNLEIYNKKIAEKKPRRNFVFTRFPESHLQTWLQQKNAETLPSGDFSISVEKQEEKL